MENSRNIIQLDSASLSLGASEAQTVGVAGMFVHVRSATGEFEIKTNNGDRVPVVSGEKVRFPTPFESLTVKDLSGSSNAIEIIYGAGGDFQSDTLSGSISLNQGSAIADSAVSVLGTATVLVAAGSGRESLRFQNLGTDDIYIGSTGVTVATGQKIAAGETHIEDNAPNAAWSAIASVAGQDTRVQVIS